MADIHLVCESCQGKRFKEEILEVEYEGKNIDDILNMTVDEAIADLDEPWERRILRNVHARIMYGYQT